MIGDKRALYFVFFFAGIPALVYQVTWQRALGLYFGVDVHSATVTVATFMGGLGFGALLGGILAERTRRPVVVYAVIELLLGLLGAISPFVITAVGGLVAGASLPVVALAAAGMMVLPTLMMGATLPIMSRIVVTSDADVGASLSSLYGLNTLGAAFGALATAYLFIGALGLDGAAWLAATINVVLAASVAWLARRTKGTPQAPAPSDDIVAARGATAPRLSHVLLLAFGSGLVALGYEIVWYRLLGVILHGTVYVFGTILAMYLLGIAVGALFAKKRVDAPDPLVRFGRAQVMMSAYVLLFATVLGYGSQLPGLRHLLSASFFTSFHPSPLLVSEPLRVTNLYSLLDIPLWSIAMLGVPTFLMGFGFPHLMRAASAATSHVGAAVGRVYAANIVGSILGTLVVGFVGLDALGSEITLKILVVVGALVGAFAMFVAGADPVVRRRVVTAGAVVAVLALAVGPGRGRLLRATHFAADPSVQFSSREETSGVVALRRQDRVIAFGEEAKIVGQQKLYIDGAAHGRGDEAANYEASISLALGAEPAPRRVLAIGLGDGNMCDAVIGSPHVTELVIVELNGGLFEILKETERGARIARSPKLRYVEDDGRRWLFANPTEKFDLVMTFPLHAAHAGYGNLFSHEFFALVSRHLAPEGIFYTRTVDAYATPRTLANAFTSVIRLDAGAYIAKNGSLRFSRARLPFPEAMFMERVDADRETILRNTEGVAENHDLRPQSEYYLTYRHAASMMGSESPFPEAERSRFAAMLVP